MSRIQFRNLVAILIATLVSFASLSPANAKDYCLDNDEVCTLTFSAASKPKGQKSYLGKCSDINGFSTGYDRFTSLALDTEYGNNVVTTGSKVNVELTLSLNCAMDTGYQPRLILTKGVSTRLVYLNPTDFAKQSSLDFPIRDFCFTNSCYVATYTGELEIPSDASLGSYTLKLAVIPTVENDFSNTSSSFTFGSGITVKSDYYEPPKKLEIDLQANNQAGFSYCFINEISREAIDYYGISSTVWKVSQRNLNKKVVLLDEFEIPVQSSTSAEQKLNQEKKGVSGLFVLESGITYAYVPTRQVKGATLICTATVKATSGDWATLTKSSKMPRNGLSAK